MAVTSTFTVSGTKSGAVAGSASGTPGTLNIGSFTVTNPNSGNDVTHVTFASATFISTTVPTPPGTTYKGVWIQKPAGNAVSLTLKGVTGDTGHALNLTDPDYISLAATQTTLGIASGGAVTIELWWE